MTTRTPAHAIRTQLGVIRTAADMIERFGPRMTEAERLEEVRAIQAAVANIVTLLDNSVMFGEAE
jgi:hypothetical protein